MVLIQKICFLLLVKFIISAEESLTQKILNKHKNLQDSFIYNNLEDIVQIKQNDYIETSEARQRRMLVYDKLEILSAFNINFCDKSAIKQAQILKLQNISLQRTFTQFYDILNELLVKIIPINNSKIDISIDKSYFKSSTISLSGVLSVIINLAEEMLYVTTIIDQCYEKEQDINSDKHRFAFYKIRNRLNCLIQLYNSFFFVDFETNLKILSNDPENDYEQSFFSLFAFEKFKVLYSSDMSLFFYDTDSNKKYIKRTEMTSKEKGFYYFCIRMKLKHDLNLKTEEIQGFVGLDSFLEFLNDFIYTVINIRYMVQHIIFHVIDSESDFLIGISDFFSQELLKKENYYVMCATLIYQFEKQFFINLNTISRCLFHSMQYPSQEQNIMKYIVKQAIININTLVEDNKIEKTFKQYNGFKQAHQRLISIRTALLSKIKAYLYKKLFEQKIDFEPKLSKIKAALFETLILDKTSDIFDFIDYTILSKEIYFMICAIIERENMKYGHNWVFKKVK